MIVSRYIVKAVRDKYIARQTLVAIDYNYVELKFD